MVKKNEGKKWWKSRTIVLNLLSIAGAVVLALQGAVTEGIVLSGINVANIVLRVVSSEAIKKEWK